MAEELQPMSQEEASAWVRTQFQKANKFLAEQGIVFDAVITEESRYLPPLIAIWKIKGNDNKKYWALSGDLPTDIAPENAAVDARGLLRHFSMQWQLKAEGILANEASDKNQREFAGYLVSRAESLYQLAEKEEFWQQQPE